MDCPVPASPIATRRWGRIRFVILALAMFGVGCGATGGSFRVNSIRPLSDARLLTEPLKQQVSQVVTQCRHVIHAPSSQAISLRRKSRALHGTPSEFHLGYDELRERWDLWALDHVQTGDVVFRRGVSPILFGLQDLSDVTCRLTASEYSHAGVAVVEDGCVWVYDITRPHGARRVPFSEFLFTFRLAFGIKRLKEAHRHHISSVVSYLRNVTGTQPPFDADFRLGNGKLYCTELVAVAFEQAGLPLAEPTAIGEFPNFGDLPQVFVEIGRMHGMAPEQELYIPGNNEIGLWSSDKLDVVFSAQHPFHPPGFAPNRLQELIQAAR